ncbi:MAG TPA: cyclic nucleotide-binding domain-containing protein [Burkholderiales bacterium]|nr:cyclic nucleotide-binding domain-containing protein [Burkholderiales bacterium]
MGVVQAGEQLIGGIPLFAGIERTALEGFLRIFQPVSFAAGASLMRQGQPADGAYIIESGDADVTTALPGGGTAAVAKLGPGSVLGEMALLESGVRSATVIALSRVTGHFIERDGFRMLLAQRNRAAFTIQARIARTLCQRLRELNAKIVADDASGAAPSAASRAASRASAPASAGQPSFDWKSFLPLLPFFRRCGPAEIEQFIGLARAVELPRGHVLFSPGEPSTASYLVVRGAIEIAGARNGQRHRIGILGPGRLCGTLALIEGQPHSMGAAVRENAVLLEIGKPAFDRLFDGDDRLAARFQEAINQELLQALARTNNHLTRLVSQARIRGGRREKQQAEELQQALGTQDCRTG